MSCRNRPLPIRQAVALGVVHGPAELLPISSTGHVALIPWLLGWQYAELDGELRKSFEVALHAGAAAALLVVLRHEVADAAHGLDARRVQLVVLSFAPAALAGYALERPVERHLGTPGTIAFGLLAGGVAMALADLSPQRRGHLQADARDALWLGLAQACALVPGVSRGGATLAAARLRRFTRADANRLSRHAALPVITGAAALKGVRLYRRGLDPGLRAAFAAGAGAAFVSTLASARLARLLERGSALAPYAIYRAALALAVYSRFTPATRARRFPRARP